MNGQHQIKTLIKEKLPGQAPGDTSVSSSEERSWSMSHLPTLNPNEIAALMDLFDRWFKKQEWSLSKNCDVQLVWEYAERHGFSGMIGSLSQAGLIKDHSLKSLGQNRYLTNLLYHEKCMKICRDIQDKAIALSIPLCFIKGPTLDIVAFEEPGIRSYSDLDILIGSRKDAWTIIKELNYDCHEGETEDNLKNRLFESGRIHASYNEWVLEFCYPLENSCDPMFDVLNRHKKRWLKIPFSTRNLSMPDPEVHLLILIQHMARHLCSRFIWFLDIATFVKRHHNQIDFKWVEKELELLQMSNISSLIFTFCRQFMDKDLPVLAMKKKGWNNTLQEKITSPEQILSLVSMYHDKGFRTWYIHLLSPARFFFITDPEHHGFFMDSTASQWVAAKIIYTFNLKTRFLLLPLKKIMHLFWVPFSFLLAFIEIKGNSKTDFKKRF